MVGAEIVSERHEAPRPLTVTELAWLLRDTIRANPILERILVRGEVGSVQIAPAGHLFFTLKDANAQIACVLFREAAADVGFTLEDGMEVVASGDVDVFARRGAIELVVRALVPAGVGAFWAAFQRTRKRLAAEGLFDRARKRALPRFPRRIGVVSSEAGAVVHDIATILRRRWPSADVVLAAALVQGPEAPSSLRTALAAVAGRVDVVLLARGGGSLEDLWCFNDEGLARAIAACPVPVVSAVGHETDVTIADFVADVRAPTPSAAAELVSPDGRDVIAEVRRIGSDLLRVTQNALRTNRARLAATGERLSPAGLRRDVASNRTRLRSLGTALAAACARALERAAQHAESAGKRLHALSPLATMERGYAILTRPDGRVVSRAADVRTHDALAVRLRDGILHVLVHKREVS